MVEKSLCSQAWLELSQGLPFMWAAGFASKAIFKFRYPEPVDLFKFITLHTHAHGAFGPTTLIGLVQYNGELSNSNDLDSTTSWATSLEAKPALPVEGHTCR